MANEVKADMGSDVEPVARLASAFNSTPATYKEALDGSTAVTNPSTNNATTTTHHYGPTNRAVIAVIVYFALLLDNVLLTVIVPILPDYLASLDNKTSNPPLDVDSGAAADHNRAYRNMEPVLRSVQSIMTKHPIPGKSMVHFSLEDADIAATEIRQQQRREQQPEPLKQQSSQPQRTTATATDMAEDRAANGTENNLANESSSIGILLAMKALIQLIFNPIVGNLSSRFGYRLPIVFGTFCLLLSSLGFAVGDTYATLLIARSIQGVGSACIGVCGMSLVAQHYPEEERRSKVMGIILGSIALGVLLGYPIGGILYDLVGKSAPFIILSTIVFLHLCMQVFTMDLSVQPEVIIVDANSVRHSKWEPLLENKMILAIVVAIWLSTSTMAILEPCLPIWLMQHLKPYKWQLGTVFIPDSVGYFVGTNFFGTFAYNNGQVKITCISLLLVGISSILIPNATTVWQLLLPHFFLGLGIGIIDAALVPLLATFVDATLSNEDGIVDNESGGSGCMTSYGTVYAIQQTSVSLAYCLAPLLGGELAQAIGFAWLMRIVGFINIVYGPILVMLYNKYDPKVLNEKRNQILLSNSGRGTQYKKLYNSVDME